MVGIKSLKSISSSTERRLVEYFVVVSSTPRSQTSNDPLLSHNHPFGLTPRGAAEDQIDSEFHEEFQPTITARYPKENHEGNPLHESVSCFCHPTGSIQMRLESSMPKIHYFVSTGGKGQQMYGTCLTLFEPHTLKSKDADSDATKDVFLPKCLCILSAYPYLIAFREYLSQLHRLATSGSMPLPVERYILNFCSEIPAPPPGSFEVQTTILDSVIRLWSPPYNQPIAWVSLPFSHLFQCLDLDNILQIWHALTLERQVLMTSTQLSLLTECCEILMSLLFPMRWSHAYIPVLPHFLIPILSAPMPYLCGIDKFNLPSALFDLSRECIVVDLDKNEVTMGPMTPALPPLPKALGATLRGKLEKSAGMVFREARCLTKSDDYSDRGIHLKPHVKEMSDAAWEGQLCLFDEAFRLYFTPEEARKNKLNGTDGSGGGACEGGATLGKFLTKKEKLANMRSQSQWDGVQEAFLGVYATMLSQYRRFLVFPSKSTGNEGIGTYGGAGFRSKQFVQSQRRENQPFLKQLVSTQMFDDFITKRLFGSGEADVLFFDQAVDKLSKVNDEPTSFGKLFRKAPLPTEMKTPLLQSARVRRKLKTIVPPEPTSTGLPIPGIGAGSVQSGDALVSMHIQVDDNVSVCSNSTGGGSRYSHGSKQRAEREAEPSEEDNHGIGKYTYTYPTFPTSFSDDLFGTPRPLPSAVLAEFDRQREDAGRFTRRSAMDVDEAATMGLDALQLMDKNPSTSAEVATFTLFFISFTAAVGKELLQISEREGQGVEEDKTILSSCQPSQAAKEGYEEKDEGGSDNENSSGSATEVIVANELVTASSLLTDDCDNNTEGTFDENDAIDKTKKKTTDDDASEDGETEPASDDAEKAANDHPDKDENPTPQDQDAEQDKPPEKPTPNKQMSLNAIINSFTPNHHRHNTLPTSKSKTTPKASNLGPRNRFNSTLSNFKILEAKVTARAQLGLAFDMLDMMRQRQLKADPAAYQCLIDACGRCGDTERATKLLGRMHEDGIVADGVVYSCLVSAFSAENAWKKLTGGGIDEHLPEWANGVSVEMDWNKLQKRSFVDIAMQHFTGTSSRFNTSADDASETDNSTVATNDTPKRAGLAGLRDKLTKSSSDRAAAAPPPPTHLDVRSTPNYDATQKKEMVMTKPVLMQVLLGENLLELIYPDISIDTDNELCPRCHMHLMDDDVVLGWTPCDSQDYTTTCPNCTLKFVPHFCVQSTSPSFIGSRGPSSPLFCERLSPWVLQKELRSVMSEGIDNLLNAEWRGSETKNATLWWNLVLSFMRYRLPFSFLLQGSFDHDLIVPTPDDE